MTPRSSTSVAVVLELGQQEAVNLSIVRVVRLGRRRNGDPIEKPVNQRRLCGQQPFACLCHREPRSAVNLREGTELAAPGRPFHFETIGREHPRIKIPGHCPCNDPFTARLDHLAQRFELALGRVSGLLGKFARGGRQWIFAFGIFALGDRPGPPILLGPKRSAGMDQQQEEVVAFVPVHENARAPLLRGCPWDPKRHDTPTSEQCVASR